jgi:hypothetical protein
LAGGFAVSGQPLAGTLLKTWLRRATSVIEALKLFGTSGPSGTPVPRHPAARPNKSDLEAN